MSSVTNTYFQPIKEQDRNKAMMHLNEPRDRAFEGYVGEIIQGLYVENLMRYPNEAALYKAYSEFYKIPEQYLAVGHGSDEIIGRLFQLHKDKSIFIGPHEYYMAAHWAEIHKMNRTNNPNEAEVIYIGNPNSHNGVNNTARVGFYLAMGKIVIVDEVYAWFNSNRENTFMYDALTNPNLWVIESMSKAFGFCGFRAGLAVSTKENIEDLHMIRQGVTSNSLACEVIPKILANETELMGHLERLREGKAYLESKYAHEPSCGPYSLLKLSELPEEFTNKVHYLKGTTNARVACATKDYWELLGV